MLYSSPESASGSQVYLPCWLFFLCATQMRAPPFKNTIPRTCTTARSEKRASSARPSAIMSAIWRFQGQPLLKPHSRTMSQHSVRRSSFILLTGLPSLRRITSRSILTGNAFMMSSHSCRAIAKLMAVQVVVTAAILHFSERS